MLTQPGDMLFHLKQVPDDGGVAAMGTQVQRGIPLGVGGVDHRACAAAAPAGPQQQLDGVRVATPCGQVQRGVAVAVQAVRQAVHHRPTPHTRSTRARHIPAAAAVAAAPIHSARIVRCSVVAALQSWRRQPCCCWQQQ
eukprot:COSAG01_NODE_3399_length_6142_cov_11.969236_6_plen_139_part_00